MPTAPFRWDPDLQAGAWSSRGPFRGSIVLREWEEQCQQQKFHETE